MNIAQQVQEKLLTLQGMIHNAHPQMPSLLREIHTTLKNDPEVVTLLSDDDLAILVSSLQVQTNTSLAASVVKASKSTKGLKNITLDQL